MVWAALHEEPALWATELPWLAVSVWLWVCAQEAVWALLWVSPPP